MVGCNEKCFFCEGLGPSFSETSDQGAKSALTRSEYLAYKRFINNQSEHCDLLSLGRLNYFQLGRGFAFSSESDNLMSISRDDLWVDRFVDSRHYRDITRIIPNLPGVRRRDHYVTVDKFAPMHMIAANRSDPP
jgi:hypothetical protein